MNTEVPLSQIFYARGKTDRFIPGYVNTDNGTFTFWGECLLTFT